MSEQRRPGRAVTDSPDDAGVPLPRPGSEAPDAVGDGEQTPPADPPAEAGGPVPVAGGPVPVAGGPVPADVDAVPADVDAVPADVEAAGTEAAGTEAAGTEAAGTEAAGTEPPGTEGAAPEAASDVGDPPKAAGDDLAGAAPARRRRRRDPLAAALIGVLTLLLGFAFAVQVRSTDQDTQLSGAREEDLVRILDDLNAQEDRLRQQITDQRSTLNQLTNSDSQSATALEEARRRAEAIGILNGTVAAQGPGLHILVRDPEGEVRVADLLDAVEELRGAGAETMQIDAVRVGVSTAVTGDPGALSVDGHAISAPYDILVIGSPQDLETAMNIPGGVVQRINGRGGSVEITQSQQVVVDALRPLDQPEYASPKPDGD
jgi:uncharacterized protein YlxW (UPF0749 family)